MWWFSLIWKTYQDSSIYWLSSPSTLMPIFCHEVENFHQPEKKSGIRWAFLGLAGGVQWLKPTTLEQETNQRLNFYLLILKLLFFFFFPEKCVTLVVPRPWEVTPMRWDLSPNPLSVTICQRGDKLLFPQRLFHFFHHPPHFSSSILSSLGWVIGVFT